jgi:flavin reductase
MSEAAMTTNTSPPSIQEAGPVAVDAFREAMALLPGAVTVITTDGPQGAAGFTASAVCSVTDSPPTLLVCMNRSSFAHRFFAGNQVLCVNVLQGDQQELSALVSNRQVPMAERFARCPHSRLASGAPALDRALVNCDGRIVATHAVGTHDIFIVELAQVRVGDGAGQPPAGLAYFNRRYHALGQAAP